MPSTVHLITALGASAAVFLGGGWLAGQASAQPVSGSDAPAPNVAATAQHDEVAPHSPGTRTGLQVEVTDIHPGEGHVVMLVFDSAEGYASFDIEAVVGFEEQRANTETLRFVFEDLTAGPYAIVTFHDENGDYDLAMNGSYPAEGYGGTGIERWYDDPGFADAAIATGEATVRLHYLD